MIVVYLDRSHSFFNEIARSFSDCSLVDNPSDAKLALVLVASPVSKIESLLKEHPHLLILTPVIPHDFNDERVYYLNGRCRDLDMNCFVNHLWDIRSTIVHIDVKIGYNSSINLRTEAMEALSVISMLIPFDVSKLNVRMSFNEHNVHVSCYERAENFTASCYITKESNDTFFEEVTVFTLGGGRYTLDAGDMGAHTYAERYAAAWQTIMEETLWQRKRTYQIGVKKLISKTKGSSSRFNRKRR